MTTLSVVNIKCGGCEKKITDSLTKAGLSSVSVDVPNGQVSFEGDTETARTLLSGLGYPETGSKEAQSLFKKGYSYFSCMIGRMQ
jgi:copper chaperone CopZ